MELQPLLDRYIQSPESPEINFDLGVIYQEYGQTASAVSFYIRCAERTNDSLLKYEALLRASMCFATQGSRGTSVKGMLQHAITLQPNRPEGYFYLSRFYEQTQQWFDGYLISSLGAKLAIKNPSPLRTTLDYPGYYGILFEKAVVSWWTGLCGESRELFRELAFKHALDPMHRQAVKNNFINLGLAKNIDLQEEIDKSNIELNLYKKKLQNDLKHKFFGINKIHRNYSEAYQDMFVLSMLNGKQSGTFVEIGTGYPLYGNNTYLLESQFNWQGLSIDIDQGFTERFFNARNSNAICADATKIDYIQVFKDAKLPSNIDYLQLDCDPPEVTFEILQRIPFQEYKFATITFEHDTYITGDSSIKIQSRQFLLGLGYELVVSNVCPKEGQDFEDWYIHPDLVSREIINKIKNTYESKKTPNKIFFRQ